MAADCQATGKPIEAMPAPRCAARLGCRAGPPVGLGVDRLDYTKGILERLRAVERLLELHPEWIGRFTFVQIAAPTPLVARRVPAVRGQVRAPAAQINDALRQGGYEPVRLKIEHHEPDR